jgi:hypothetical protein
MGPPHHPRLGLRAAAVVRERQAIPLLLVALALCLVAACVPTEGGAVEASWVIRSEGRAVSECGCADPEISRVRFRVVAIDASGTPGPDWCAGRAACEFACRRQIGTTPFAIPGGRYAISLTAIGPNGEDLALPPASGSPPRGQARIPAAPILRDVVQGQPTSLDAFVIEAGCAPACAGQGNSSACSKG